MLYKSFYIYLAGGDASHQLKNPIWAGEKLIWTLSVSEWHETASEKYHNSVRRFMICTFVDRGRPKEKV